jgi:hypothetical protein
MIDDVSFVESLIKQRLPTVTVFQNSTDEAEAEVDVQNVPGKDLSMVRVFLSRANAAAIRRDPNLADRVVATIQQALDSPSAEPEAALDLRGSL